MSTLNAIRRLVADVITLALATGVTGCASARMKKENALALARADARVLEGCYDCLQDARRVYERLAVGKNSSGIVARLFETDVLLSLREKELGLDSRVSFERAQALVPRVPPTLQPNRVLAMADAVLPDGNAQSMKGIDALIRSHKAYVEKIDDELAWIEQAPLTPPARKYIALALDCSYPDRDKDKLDSSLAKRRELPINAPPLTAYRAADCAKADTLALKRVLLQVPTFDEAAYGLAKVVVWNAQETGGDDARRYFDAVRARFPRAAGAKFMSGWLNLTIGDCDQAIRYYDETLTIEPKHDRAMLQKTTCQSNLHQDSAAIATATQFIALETADIAEGYYWRAISRLRRKELELARSDIESAKARSRTGEILTVAGIIEHEQNDLSIAETDLRAARAKPKGVENCNAAFYLGSVLTKREVWGEAAVSFDSAMVCYSDKASVIAAWIESVRQSTKGSPQFRAKRIAALESDLADRRKRSYSSAFNAASMNARLGNFGRAWELLAVADQSSELTEQVGKLREQLAQATHRKGSDP